MSPRDSLSTPHINRLLRPLRNKCTVLASSSPNPTQPQTYSNNRSYQTGWSSRYSPPLTPIQPPGNIGIRIHLDDDYIRAAELARRIYAIRDCFRNVVQVSFGVGVGVNGSYRHALRIPSLAAMCAIVIGTTIQAEFDEIVAAKAANYNDHLDSDEVMELAYGMYEAIPPHYRRCVFVRLLCPLFVLYVLSLIQVDNCQSCTVHDTEHVSSPPYALDHPAGRMSLVGPCP
jgi:hypothetical protein